MDLYTLNDRQREAVTTTEGPLLVLAGAGSGKTRVLTYRIAYMIKDCSISPFSILALTFTNKAAREMKERTQELVGDRAADMWISTFHSSCARILRMDGDKLGIDKTFTIYDDSERKSIIAPILSRMQIDEKLLNKNAALHMISDAKNHSDNPTSFFSLEYPDLSEVLIPLYREYEKAMRTANALDFDDLILMTLKLLREYPDILEKYRNKFKYVLVDEYQDTNMPQYQLVRLICAKHKNICVVGDDDQSIYGWRGADIRNILGFEQDFEGARVIRLEQNYRSTGNILDAANAVICNNRGRKGKRLWTASGSGSKIVHYTAYNERDEADFICKEIDSGLARGTSLKDYAVLYRTNAQSRIIESAFISYGIKYRVFGGQRFYERMEIKDIMAYLRLIANPNDNAAFKRIINIPARGIGAKSLENLEELAYGKGLSMMSYLLNPACFSSLTGAMQKKFAPFISLYKELTAMREEKNTVAAMTQELIFKTGYMNYLSTYDTEFESRCENIDELIGVITEIEEGLSEDDDALTLFLENAALATDMDEGDDEGNFVSLMTIHSAKGLEFNNVFIVGTEEGLFPSTRSLEDEQRLEEERRLCYVAITRARKKLYIINAQSRRLYNRTEYHKPSRFLDEIPESLMDEQGSGSGRRGYVFSDYDDYDTHSYSSTGSSTTVRYAAKPTYSTVKTAPSMPAKPAMPPKPKVNPDADKLDVGMRVHHTTFGDGSVTAKSGSGSSAVLTVKFDNGDIKKLAAAFAPLTEIK